MFNTNVLGTCNVARAGARYLREAAQVPGQRAGLATFGSLGSWWSGAGVAHCKLLSTLPIIDLVCWSRFANRYVKTAAASGP